MEAHGEFRIDPICLDSDGVEGELEVVVPYTGPETTAAALARSGALMAGLNARLRLIAVHTLPYPVPFVCPALVHAHLVEQLMDLASQSALAVEAQVILSRDWLEGFRFAMKPGSTVVIATHKRVWRTEEEKLARALAGQGHKVALLHIA